MIGLGAHKGCNQLDRETLTSHNRKQCTSVTIRLLYHSTERSSTTAESSTSFVDGDMITDG